MRAIFSFLATVLMIVYFSSCQKEVDWQLPDELIGDSVFIKKILSIDTTKPVGQDTGFITVYDYDSQRRLIKLTETENDNNIQHIHTTKFSYSGNDTLPFKYTFTNNPFSDSSITFLFYNNGFVVKDSTLNFFSGSLDNVHTAFYTSLGGSKYLYRSYDSNPSFPGLPQIRDSIIYTRNANNGNVLSGVDSVWYSGAYQNKISFQSIYDNQKSPFAKQSLWYLGFYTSVLYDNYFIGQNNILSISSTYDPGGPQNIGQANYTFNSSGYPVIGRMKDIGDYNKLIFTYINL